MVCWLAAHISYSEQYAMWVECLAFVAPFAQFWLGVVAVIMAFTQRRRTGKFRIKPAIGGTVASLIAPVMVPVGMFALFIFSFRGPMNC